MFGAALRAFGIGRSIEKGTEAPGFGTFKGVYLPSVLTIFGVIMYLRLGWIVGALGLISTLSIITLASSITLITALSIASMATNMRIEGGGAYYLISRSFGKEVGAAIGLPLYLAQTIGIAFYISGFAESVIQFFPQASPHVINLVVLVGVTTLSYTSASIALKAQLIIFAIVVASLISFFLGTPLDIPALDQVVTAPKIGYWAAFALFFPAVTGIEAGVSMSGELKNPSRSLAWGTILAVVTGLCVYWAMAVWFSNTASSYQLLTDPLIVVHLAKVGSLIILGIWGATLSSAIGGFLGAPRTLQALAVDGVLPRLLGKGYGAAKSPQIATVVTFLLTGLALFYGNINMIAPVLTMFFLITYCILNLATGVETLLNNPSWRPSFLIPSYIPFIGVVLCLFIMFMIDSGSTFISMVVVLGIYLLMQKKRFTNDWEDVREGLIAFLARSLIYKLNGMTLSARSWRPNFLLLISGYSLPDKVIRFTSEMTNEKGFLTIASLVPGESYHEQRISIKKRILDLLKLKNVQALVTLLPEKNILDGTKKTIHTVGFGALSPNTLILHEGTQANGQDELESLLYASKYHKNVVVLRETEQSATPVQSRKQPFKLDIWWDNDERDNSELMIVLGHMFQAARRKEKVVVTLKGIVSDEVARGQLQKHFEKMLAERRLSMKTDIYVSEGLDAKNKLITHFSKEADVVFLSLDPKREDESFEEFSIRYKAQISIHKQFKSTAFFLSSGPIDLL